MDVLASSGGPWVGVPEDGQNHGKGNPPDQVIKMMEEHGQHGILISGLISWMEVNRHQAAGTIWREVAETAWEHEEVTEAKKLLVSVLTTEHVDLIKQEKDKEFAPARTGSDRQKRKVRDINDIVTILEFLSDRGIMPLLMTSPCQIRKTPKSLGSLSPEASMGEMATKVQSLENCLEKNMKCTKQQIETLTEIVTEQREANPSEAKKKSDGGTREDVEEVEIVKDSYANKVLGAQPLSKHLQKNSQNHPQIQEQQHLLKNVLKNTLGKKVGIHKNSEKPKGKSIFHGKAKPTENEGEAELEANLAADVELVAFGVNKTAEPEHLKKFLADKGIKAKEVICLTKIELIKEDKVRAKTMKVTVEAIDLEKAMNPEVWPLRVGVRYFKAPSRRPALEEGEQAGEGGLQERQGGQGQGAWQGGSQEGGPR